MAKSRQAKRRQQARKHASTPRAETVKKSRRTRRKSHPEGRYLEQATATLFIGAMALFMGLCLLVAASSWLMYDVGVWSMVIGSIMMLVGVVLGQFGTVAIALTAVTAGVWGPAVALFRYVDSDWLWLIVPGLALAFLGSCVLMILDVKEIHQKKSDWESFKGSAVCAVFAGAALGIILLIILR